MACLVDLRPWQWDERDTGGPYEIKSSFQVFKFLTGQGPEKQ